MFLQANTRSLFEILVTRLHEVHDLRQPTNRLACLLSSTSLHSPCYDCAAVGFSQRSRANRPKSVSHETSVAPWDMASEAKWASVVRLPAVPA